MRFPTRAAVCHVGHDAAAAQLGTIVFVCIANPWVLLVVVPLVMFFFRLRAYYLAASREIKRLESTTRSPIYSLLSEVLAGLATLRGYSIAGLMTARFDGALDANTRACVARAVRVRTARMPHVRTPLRRMTDCIRVCISRMGPPIRRRRFPCVSRDRGAGTTRSWAPLAGSASASTASACSSSPSPPRSRS